MNTHKFLIVFLFSYCNNSINFGIIGLIPKVLFIYIYIRCVNPGIIDIPIKNIIFLSNNYKKHFLPSIGVLLGLCQMAV